MTTEITCKVLRNGSKIKSTACTLGGTVYNHISNKGLWRLVRDNPESDIKVLDRRSGRDETFEKLLNVLITCEKPYSKVNLSRVIREGGFQAYIKKLEKEVNK